MDTLTHLTPAQREQAAIDLAERFAAKGMILTANEILVEVGLPPRRWG